MKRTRIRKIRKRYHRQHGHKWRSRQMITRAARIAMWTREIESFNPQAL